MIRLLYDVPVVKQERLMSCWFAACRMVKLFNAMKGTRVPRTGAGGKEALARVRARMHWGLLRAHVEQVYLYNPASSQYLSRSELRSKEHATGKGLTRHEMSNWARQQGFAELKWDPNKYGMDELEDYLRSYGPLYCAGLFARGQAHAIVVCGLADAHLNHPDGGGSADHWVLYNDPISGKTRISIEDFNWCFSLPSQAAMQDGLMMYSRY